MKIIFAGTPEFAAHALKALAQEHQIVCVLTQPDRPNGRGMKLKPSPVKEVAMSLNLPFRQPETLKNKEIQDFLRSLNTDVMVVAAYGLLLPKAVLEIPFSGCLNIHASLLPRWRGAAPIQRAIEAGDQETGICIMQMDEGLDTGDVLYRVSCQIHDHDTAGTLHDRLMLLGTEIIVHVLRDFSQTRQPQTSQGITYAKKISKDEARIVWQDSAITIERKIRAFNPFPVCWTTYQGNTWKIRQARVVSEVASAKAGTIVQVHSDGIVVATGEQCIEIQDIQTSGGKRMAVKNFLAGNTVAVGEILGASFESA